MRLIQFLSWWWEKNDWFNRTIAVITTWAVPCILSTIFVGKVGVLFAFGGAISVGVAWLLFGIFYWFRSLWREFDAERPTDDVKIVRRLKGETPVAAEYYD